MWKTAIKHPQAPQGTKMALRGTAYKKPFFVDEERSGGVAAIAKPR